jgi:hypothetical protein
MKPYKFLELNRLNEEITNILDNNSEINQLDQMYFDILFEEFDEQVKILQKNGVSKGEILDFLKMENSDVENPEARKRFLELCDNFENFAIKTSKDKNSAN